VKSPTFLCIGDIDVDLIVTVESLPNRDGKINGRQVARAPGGMAANAAAALARLGAVVRLFGAVGADEAGEFALASLRRAGVDVSPTILVEGAATFGCISLITPEGEKSLVRLVTDAYLPSPAALTADLLTGVTHVHTTFGSPDLALRALGLATAAKVTRSLDLELADISSDSAVLNRVLTKTDILFCNEASRAALDAALGAPATTFGAIVVTTLGDSGSRLETADAVHEAVGFPVAALDTTGAGDCFAAAFLFASLQQVRSWNDSLIFANAAAALSTLGYGAQSSLPDSHAVDVLIAERPRPASLKQG
jgi:ribokinase